MPQTLVWEPVPWQCGHWEPTTIVQVPKWHLIFQTLWQGDIKSTRSLNAIPQISAPWQHHARSLKHTAALLCGDKYVYIITWIEMKKSELFICELASWDPYIVYNTHAALWLEGKQDPSVTAIGWFVRQTFLTLYSSLLVEKRMKQTMTCMWGKTRILVSIWVTGLHSFIDK